MHVSYHIGAHGVLGRCVNFLLDVNAEHLKSSEIIAPKRSVYRALMQPFLQSDDPDLTNRENLETLHDALIVVDNCQNLVISDGAFLCGRNGILRGGQLYSNLERRLAKLDAMFPDYSFAVHFSVEGMDTFVPRILDLTDARRVKTFQNLPHSFLSWVDVIKRIRSVFGRTEIFVWVTEDFPHTKERLFEAFTRKKFQNEIKGLTEAEKIFLKNLPVSIDAHEALLWSQSDIRLLRDQYVDELDLLEMATDITVIRSE